MATALDVVNDALRHLRVLDAHEEPAPADVRDAIRALNLMCRSWEAEGLPLGWHEVSLPSDVLSTPPEAEEAIGYNLALRLRATYGVTLDQDTVQQATDGLALLRAMVATSAYARIDFEDLPQGQGRHSFGNWRAGYYR